LCPAEREPGTLTLLRPPPLELGHAQAHVRGRGAAVARIAQEADRLIAALELRPSDLVADIGAGTGYLAVRIAQQLKSGTVFAIDVEPDYVPYLQRHPLPA